MYQTLKRKCNCLYFMKTVANLEILVFMIQQPENMSLKSGLFSRGTEINSQKNNYHFTIIGNILIKMVEMYHLYDCQKYTYAHLKKLSYVIMECCNIHFYRQIICPNFYDYVNTICYMSDSPYSIILSKCSIIVSKSSITTIVQGYLVERWVLRCSPERVHFRHFRVYQGCLFYLKIGLNICSGFCKMPHFPMNFSFGLPLGCQ